MLTPSLSMAFKYIQKLKRTPAIFDNPVRFFSWVPIPTYIYDSRKLCFKPTQSRSGNSVPCSVLLFYGDVEWQAVCSPPFFSSRHDQMVESERLVLNRESITLIVKPRQPSLISTDGFPPPALSVDLGLSPWLQLHLKTRWPYMTVSA